MPLIALVIKHRTISNHTMNIEFKIALASNHAIQIPYLNVDACCAGRSTFVQLTL